MTPRDKANKWCSHYIRLRDAIEWNKQFAEDITGVDPKILKVKCCTCSTIKAWVEMEAGHWIARSSGGQSGVYYDERNIHAQCKGCNQYQSGRPKEYEEFMYKNYSPSVIAALRVNDKLIQDMSTRTLNAIAKMYKSMYEGLLKFL